tara:strand:- start:270 stop:572 length:303 start_codon:yes stop_codon:yes gene_type:complete
LFLSLGSDWLLLIRRVCERVQIHAARDNPLALGGGGSYSVRVILGRRDEPLLEVYARTLVELVNKGRETPLPVLLGISIKEHSPSMFRTVMHQISTNRVW